VSRLDKKISRSPQTSYANLYHKVRPKPFLEGGDEGRLTRCRLWWQQRSSITDVCHRLVVTAEVIQTASRFDCLVWRQGGVGRVTAPGGCSSPIWTRPSTVALCLSVIWDSFPCQVVSRLASSHHTVVRKWTSCPLSSSPSPPSQVGATPSPPSQPGRCPADHPTGPSFYDILLGARK
jgi:hypothetical protein